MSVTTELDGLLWEQRCKQGRSGAWVLKVINNCEYMEENKGALFRGQSFHLNYILSLRLASQCL